MLWQALVTEARKTLEVEPVLASYVNKIILMQDGLASSLATHLALRLDGLRLPEATLRALFLETLATFPEVCESVSDDLRAVFERDAACPSILHPYMYFKGFQALLCYRIAHALWLNGRRDIALFLQSRVSEVFSVDIHPAAHIGRGIMMDHATSVVIGETAVVGDNVSLLHEVTLGGTGKETGDRHPKISSGVMIGAGAKILGNISVGEGAKIGAGSVVLTAVPAHTTVAGVPAVIIGKVNCAEPAREMDQGL